MPQYKVAYAMVDSQNRSVSKTFETANLADFAAATTAASGLATDLGNLTGARILSYSITERTVYTDTVTSGANRDEGLTLVVRKTDNFKDIIRVPAPIDVFDGNGNVDVTNVAVAAFVSNFLTGGDFTFSDGEQAAELLSGSLDK